MTKRQKNLQIFLLAAVAILMLLAWPHLSLGARTNLPAGRDLVCGPEAGPHSPRVKALYGRPAGTPAAGRTVSRWASGARSPR